MLQLICFIVLTQCVFMRARHTVGENAPKRSHLIALQIFEGHSAFTDDKVVAKIAVHTFIKSVI